MQINVQYKLTNKVELKKYLRTHSYWYKYLNREPDSLKKMESEYKEEVRKIKMERASEAMNTLEMLTSIVNTLK